MIGSANHTIAVAAPYGTDITGVASTFDIYEPTSVVKIGTTTQVSETTLNDWISGTAKTYTVTSDGVSQDWAVTVTVAENDEAEISAYSLMVGETPVVGVIDEAEKTIAVEVPNGTTVTALVATFTASGDSSVVVGSTPQVSGTTPNDFTSAVTYTVTSQDEVGTADYTVTVTEAAAG